MTIEELPLTVWLRGDEAHFPSFSLDADGAMEYLGIRRSRLTQISGKELRVGKARVDRYIRALYRPEDLETYRQWTRRTAAHQRSAEVVQNVTARIDNAQGQLLSSLNENLEDAHASLRHSFGDQLQTLRYELHSAQSLQERLRSEDSRRQRQTLELLGATKAELQHAQSTRESYQHNLSGKLAILQELVLHLQQKIDLLAPSYRVPLQELQEAVAGLAERCQEQTEALQVQRNYLAQEFREYQQCLVPLEARLSQLESAIHATQLPPPMQRPAFRPNLVGRQRKALGK